ncbi:MAG: OPT/YSL family transporter [Planctomycetota bacterium]|nr:OPT/YSL family transporter [Planctomycetaceae bacterium]MDQ3329467.1 OPT/YSL family transporter [Planctomycetota bacterium]
MTVAVGMYLPFGLAVPILLGGVIRSLVDSRSRVTTTEGAQRGVLMASGLIAGESLVGVSLGLFAYLGVTSIGTFEIIADKLGLSSGGQDILAQWMSLAALLAIAAWVFVRATRRENGGV